MERAKLLIAHFVRKFVRELNSVLALMTFFVCVWINVLEYTPRSPPPHSSYNDDIGEWGHTLPLTLTQAH